MLRRNKLEIITLPRYLTDNCTAFYLQLQCYALLLFDNLQHVMKHKMTSHFFN